ncbi:MAG: hypoxanthine phosphoribosyltransferase [Alphaproteobacteria bacterium]
MTAPDVLIGETALAGRLDALAAEILAAMPPDLMLLTVLKGSFVFAADLARALYRRGGRPQIGFVRLQSYGRGTETSGEVRLIGEPPTDLAGRHVLVVEDIVDTGLSLDFALRLLAAQGPAVVRSCALLHKPSRRRVPRDPDFVGFPVPDLFVVGYGLDYAEDYRYLPYIGVIRPGTPD